jgi:hypothetical protein
MNGSRSLNNGESTPPSRIAIQDAVRFAYDYTQRQLITLEVGLVGLHRDITFSSVASEVYKANEAKKKSLLDFQDSLLNPDNYNILEKQIYEFADAELQCLWAEVNGDQSPT